MKVRITESQLRQVIEERVRKYLRESEEEMNKEKDIRMQLKDPGINQAEVARYLIKTIWSDIDEDTARSLLSKKVRGVISITEEEKEFIKQALEGIIKLK